VCWDFFWDKVQTTICLSWFKTAILLISASWVDRLTGVSHWHLALLFLGTIWIFPSYMSPCDAFQPMGKIEVKGTILTCELFPLNSYNLDMEVAQFRL
jgi:hypothetical protein